MVRCSKSHHDGDEDDDDDDDADVDDVDDVDDLDDVDVDETSYMNNNLCGASISLIDEVRIVDVSIVGIYHRPLKVKYKK